MSELADATAALLKEATTLLEATERELDSERRRADQAAAQAKQAQEEVARIRLVKIAADDRQIHEAVDQLVEIGYVTKSAAAAHVELLRNGGQVAACNLLLDLAKTAVFALDRSDETPVLKKSATTEVDKLTRVWREARRSALGH